MKNEKTLKKTFVVTFEATTNRQYSVQADSFEDAYNIATIELAMDETVSDVWSSAAEVVGMAVTVKGKEIIREAK